MKAVLSGKEVRHKLEAFPHATVTSISMPTWIFVLSRLVLLSGEQHQKHFSDLVRSLLEKYLSGKEFEGREFTQEQIETVLKRSRRELKAELIRSCLGWGQSDIKNQVTRKGSKKAKDPADVLKELKRLFDAGAITEADLTKQKEEILKSLRS